jgi:multidrug efflux system outer membrane protein
MAQGRGLSGPGAAPAYSYRDVLADPRLVALIDQGWRIIRISPPPWPMSRRRGQFRCSAALFPELDASGGFTHSGGDRVAGATTKGDAFNARWCPPMNSTCSGACAT